MSRAVMQQVLEALEIEQAALEYEHGKVEHIENAITALRAALAEPEQEPVAWIECDGELVWNNREAAIGRNLYTAPTPRKPLSDEQVNNIWRAVPDQALYEAVMVFARAIERAHGITGEQT